MLQPSNNNGKDLDEHKKTISEIKTCLTKKQKVVLESTSSIENKLPRQSAIAGNLTGIRIRGVTESTEKDSRSRHEHNFSEIRKALVHPKVSAEIGDIVRLGSHEEKKKKNNNAENWCQSSRGQLLVVTSICRSFWKTKTDDTKIIQNHLKFGK